MKIMVRRLLIIPARGNSKRIKNKNIKNFCGKPIIYYSLVNAKKSKLFDKIHVSTDSHKILRIVNKLGFKIDFLRSKKFSSDHAEIIDVLRFVFNKYSSMGEQFDEIWSLSACAPLITHKDLVLASNKLKKNKNKIIIPITEFSAPIEWAFKLKNKSKALIPLKNGAYKIRSQDLEKKYHDTGSFVCMSKHTLISKNRLIDKNYLGVIIPKNRSIDIDNDADWRLAESAFRNI